MWLGIIIGGVLSLLIVLPLTYIMIHPSSRLSDYYLYGMSKRWDI